MAKARARNEPQRLAVAYQALLAQTGIRRSLLVKGKATLTESVDLKGR